MQVTDFFGTSKGIAERFLSSVVAIDDQLSFDLSNGVASHQPTKDDMDEFDLETDESTSGLGVPESRASVEHQRTKPLDHNLNYQELSVAFAEHGINCSAFKPDARSGNIENIAEKILKSARAADITILDWQMDDSFQKEDGTAESDGTLAIVSIKKILEDDKIQRGRLRLIVLYTAEPDLTSIAEKIKLALTSAGYTPQLNDQKIVFTDDILKFCHIVLVRKEPEATKLTERVIELFTGLTAGLLSNAALSAIGELRSKTHHLLHTFNNQLDPAYLSHVIGLLSSPKVREKADEVAFDYAAELISEEFKSILQVNSALKASLAKEKIISWVDHVNSGNHTEFFEFNIGAKPTRKAGSQIIKDLLNATQPREIKAALTTEPALITEERDVGRFFASNRIQINLKDWTTDSHEQLSFIECKRRDGISLIDHPYEPNIKQGSIIKDHQDNYYICLQPLCDSVRLSDDTVFIFLKAKVVTADRGFSHVIRTRDGNKIKLLLTPKATNIYHFLLKPNPDSKTVKASAAENEYIIEYKIQHLETLTYKNLYWIGEFKHSVAQSISNNVAASISRVGLDTNEWLRQSAN
ncbi:response regulator receiver domain [Undibacterium sp.]|uniref:response regulator receiver domain n=1 Tax=Undibacterium sp. TaxID=1914977 RepID=UPI0025FBCECB|nr:response regulator receiver domain [Undibacterium sp.]